MYRRLLNPLTDTAASASGPLPDGLYSHRYTRIGAAHH
jgi:hypothetical protein